MTETVQSADGTTIAYDRTGTGPALVIVGGALSSRPGAAAYVPLLAPHFTTITYDRRGRGESGDTAPYAVEREIEDLQALFDAAGGSAFVYGHSSGGVLSLRATAGGLPVTRIAVYEPPFMIEGTRERPGTDFQARLEAAVAADDRAAAVELFMTEAVGIPAEVVGMIARSPAWPGMLASAHTLPYDTAIVGDGSIPVDQLRSITVPTFAMAGGASPAWAQESVAAVADAVPASMHSTFDGQEHNAAPEIVVPALVEFFLLGGSSR